MRIPPVLLLAIFMSWTGSAQYTISTVAGNGTQGFSGDNGPPNSAQLLLPTGVAVDSADNLYIADNANNRIRKVSGGVINTFAGNGTSGFSGESGPATSIQLSNPFGIALDSVGNLYIADSGNNRVRKVSGGVITTVAGGGPVVYPGGFSGDNGPATSAQLFNPSGVAVDSVGNLYIADTGNNRIRKVSAGVITTVAGAGAPYPVGAYGGDNGPATSAQMNGPASVAVDSEGNLYIADTGNNRIRKVSAGVITTVAGNGLAGFSGDGAATSVQLFTPWGIAVDSSGNLFISDSNNQLVRKVANGVIVTIAGERGTQVFGGDGGPATSAELNFPTGVAVDLSGSVYIADTVNNRIRLLKPTPFVSQNGIVPIYSSVPVIQAGSWASIYGSALASGSFLWDGAFPTSLGGTSVTINNKLAYLWLVSPTQINLQAPDDTATGLVNVVVTTPVGKATSIVDLALEGPSLSLLGDGKHVAGEIATPNGTGAYGGGTYDLVGPSGEFSFDTRPVRAGETLILYGVGFGPTTPTVSAGKVFSGSAATNYPVTITIGGVQANVTFAGITQAGLYQFNLTVPDSMTGDQPLQAMVNGVQTPAGPVVTIQ